MSRSTFITLIGALVLIWVVFTLVDAAYTGWQEAHPPQLGAPTPTPRKPSAVKGHTTWTPNDSPSLAVANRDAKQVQLDPLTGLLAGARLSSHCPLVLLCQLAILSIAMHDTQGARRLLVARKYFLPRLKKIWADAAYRGKELADWCKAEGYSDLEVVERTPGVRGFAVLPKRWIVERTDLLDFTESADE